MFDIDKEKFGAFVSQLRKEKGMTQKELSEKLFVSDKAVSKWERGLSIPDVALLIPLSEALDISVTELLECGRRPEGALRDSQQTDDMIRKVIAMSEEEQSKYRPDRLVMGLVLLGAAISGILEIWFLTVLGYELNPMLAVLGLPMILMAVFGLYFCVFAKNKLPDYYDENRISFLADGPIRINFPGLYFNNKNWPRIVRTAQLWAVIGLVALPALYFLLHTLLPEPREPMIGGILVLLVLGGLFIPMVIAAAGNGYPAGSSKFSGTGFGKVLTVLGCTAAALCLVFVLLNAGGAASGSGVRMGWVETGFGNQWSASYALHNGFRQRTVNIRGEAEVLYARFTTDSGEAAMTVTDEEGNILFSREQIGTAEFEIPLSGKATVRISGDKHKGSFELWWQ